MKPFFIVCLILLIVRPIAGQVQKAGMTKTYADSILDQRKDKNLEFMTDKDSPLTPEDKMTFLGLYYFPPDKRYRVNAILTRFDDPFHFQMKTTTERLPEYALFGKLEFRIKGKKMQLNVYQNVELIKRPGFAKHLFIPFNDPTNGLETYHGGRFLDVEIPEGNTLVLDFNLAYNPYCAYNPKYSCPIPPEENTLSIRIEAGEKKWHD